MNCAQPKEDHSYYLCIDENVCDILSSISIKNIRVVPDKI